MEDHMDNPLVRKENSTMVSRNINPIQPLFTHFFNMPFICFTFSHTSLRSDGETTHIKAEQHRYEKGQLDFSHFEGTMAGDYFKEVSKMMEHQAELFFKTITRFLPFK